MPSMDDFKILMPEQAAIAKYFDHGSEEVAEWNDGRFYFCVTLYRGEECWDVFVSYDDGSEEHDVSASDTLLGDAMRTAIADLAYEIRMDIDLRTSELHALQSFVDRIIERSEP